VSWWNGSRSVCWLSCQLPLHTQRVFIYAWRCRGLTPAVDSLTQALLSRSLQSSATSKSVGDCCLNWKLRIVSSTVGHNIHIHLIQQIVTSTWLGDPWGRPSTPTIHYCYAVGIWRVTSLSILRITHNQITCNQSSCL